MKIFRHCIAFASSCLLFMSCADGECNVVPNIRVHTSFSQANAQQAFVPNGWAYLAGGAAGLIVHNISTSQAGQSYKFVAYDRYSPVNPEQKNQVIVTNAYLIEDPASGAQWLLKDGSPAKIASCPLKPYIVGAFGNSYIVQN